MATTTIKNKKAVYLKNKERDKQEILNIYYKYDRHPGYRMMVIFLRRRGISLGRTTVKYMRELKLRSFVMPKRPRYYKGECYKKFDNLLKQDFTYLYLADGAKRYNCSIIDLYDKSVLATINSKRMEAEFIRQNSFETDIELNDDILDYIYGYYNYIRPHSSNRYIMPFEKRYTKQ